MKFAMKKNFIKVAFIAAFAAIAGYGIYANQKANSMSELILANVEALACYELPDVEVVCNSSPGKCWMEGDICMIGEYTGYRCIRTDNTFFYCSSPCR